MANPKFCSGPVCPRSSVIVLLFHRQKYLSAKGVGNVCALKERLVFRKSTSRFVASS